MLIHFAFQKINSSQYVKLMMSVITIHTSMKLTVKKLEGLKIFRERILEL